MIISLMGMVAHGSLRVCVFSCFTYVYFRFSHGGLVCILMLCSWGVLVYNITVKNLSFQEVPV